MGPYTQFHQLHLINLIETLYYHFWLTTLTNIVPVTDFYSGIMFTSLLKRCISCIYVSLVCFQSRSQIITKHYPISYNRSSPKKFPVAK